MSPACLEAPAPFTWTQKMGGVTSVADHRDEDLGDGHSGLTLTLDMRGLLIPVIGLLYKGLTNRYMELEAARMKRTAEAG